MRTAFAVVAALVLALDSSNAAEVVREGKHEVLTLDGLADPRRWAPAECTVEASEKLKANGRPSLHMHIPVDHHAGQKQYPIGWPRMYLNLKRSTEAGWEKFERFEFLAYATMSRPKPPKHILNLQIHCPAKPHVLSRNLGEIKLGEWVLISIPTRKIRNVEAVGRLGLNISESDYKHGDVLDFTFGAFRLVRSAEFGLASLKVRSAVVYRGQPTLRVELEVAGPPLKIARALPLAVCQGDRVVRREALPVTTGIQTLDVDIGELQLDPGDYTLVAFDQEPDKRKSGAFRVVETPWKDN